MQNDSAILGEFYIAMLIIHELGHILTRWKTGEQSSPAEFENSYTVNPEAGYFLQSKLFDGVLRLTAKNLQTDSWTSETRYKG